MQIRIHPDGTFESLSAAVKTELATLKADLKTITKVEGLRVKREAAKKAGNALKDKAFLAEIKKLKATLSSNRNSSVAIVREKIAKLSKSATAPKLTKSNKTGDPRRNPTRLKTLRKPKEQLSNAEHTKLEDQKEHYRGTIAIHKASLAKVPKGKKYDNRRQMLRDNIRDAEDKLNALGKKPGKAPATSPAGKAALRKQVAKQAPALKKTFAEIDAKDAAENEANLTLKDQKVLKSLRAGLKSLESTQARSKSSDEHYAARKADIKDFKDKIKAVIAKGAKK